jgi:hypothetical protein
MYAACGAVENAMGELVNCDIAQMINIIAPKTLVPAVAKAKP